jgi:hypothetical protein
MTGSHYYGSIEITIGDSAKMNTRTPRAEGHELLVTSPPYGDNKSTVPYGQHSFLPLQWIDLNDIDKGLDRSCLATTSEIDNRSLGGSLAKALEDVEELKDISASFRHTLDQLRTEPKDRAVRVAAFCRDLNNCLGPVLAALKPNAYMAWTVGNRSVGRRPVPIDKILTELLEARGAKLLTTVQRTIPNKRMAVKNGIADTMRAETIAILRKGVT